MARKDWDAIYKKHGIVQPIPNPFLAGQIPLLKKRGVKRVLDVACGTGRNAILLAENGFEVVGIDPSEKALEILHNRASEKGIKSRIKTFKGVQQELPFGNGGFDAVVALHSFHHNNIGGAKKTAGEFLRVLKRGGLLVMNALSIGDHRHGKGEEIEKNTFIKFGEIDDDVPHHFFTEKEIRVLLKGFRIIEFAEDSGHGGQPPFTPGWRSHWQIVAVKNHA